MPLIPDDKIAEIRERTDIVQVIGGHVALKRSGVNFVGLCPFHAERSPSFNVNHARQMFKCFGCGKAGDVIRFLMEHEGRPFTEVVHELAKRAGVDLPEPNPPTPAERAARANAESDRVRMLRLNRMAAEFFREQYAGPAGERARDYVERKRGIGGAVREAFQIGFAPPGWKSLVERLARERVPHELAEAAGLVRPRENQRLPPGAPASERTHFDLFRDRVMFPLLGSQGEVVAFSGRALEDSAPDGSRIPKYINSPETILYKKGEHLYGVHVARAAMRKADRALLVEGNFDVLMMHEHGFSETVAPMGTALTPAQVRMLHRSMPAAVYLLLDGDTAGSNAAARNVALFLDEELLSKVAVLPAGEDPDTFVARFGREGIELLLRRAQESVDYFCDHGWRRTGASVLERARLLEEEAAPILRRVKLPVARQKYAEQLALTLGLRPETVHAAMRGARVSQSAPEVTAAARAVDGAGTQPGEPRIDAVDRELLAVLSQHPQLLSRLREVLPAFDSQAIRDALARVLESAQSAQLDLHALAGLLPERLQREVLASALPSTWATQHARLDNHQEATEPGRVLDTILRRRRTERVEAERSVLKKKLADLGTSGDPSTVREITLRLIDLDKALKGPKG